MIMNMDMNEAAANGAPANAEAHNQSVAGAAQPQQESNTQNGAGAPNSSNGMESSMIGLDEVQPPPHLMFESITRSHENQDLHQVLRGSESAISDSAQQQQANEPSELSDLDRNRDNQNSVIDQRDQAQEASFAGGPGDSTAGTTSLVSQTVGDLLSSQNDSVLSDILTRSQVGRLEDDIDDEMIRDVELPQPSNGGDFSARSDGQTSDSDAKSPENPSRLSEPEAELIAEQILRESLDPILHDTRSSPLLGAQQAQENRDLNFSSNANQSSAADEGRTATQSQQQQQEQPLMQVKHEEASPVASSPSQDDFEKLERMVQEEEEEAPGQGEEEPEDLVDIEVGETERPQEANEVSHE